MMPARHWRGRAPGLLLRALLVLMALGGSAAAQVTAPEPRGVAVLVRYTIIALQQANVTGNYTVLRDLAGPRFQAAYTAAGLSDVFRTYRESRIDLSGAMIVDVSFADAPRITPEGFLRAVGSLPTRPDEIVFEMTFANIAGRWAVETINVGLRRPADAPALAPVPGSPPAGGGRDDITGPLGPPLYRN